MFADHSGLSLVSVEFWLCAVLGVILLRSSGSPRSKRNGFFLVNLFFFALLLTPLPLIAFGLVFLLVNFIKDRLHVLMGLILLILFIAHKRPDFVYLLHIELAAIHYSLHIERLNPVLAMLGLSYLTLRVIDLARAVTEGRQPAPGFIDAVNYLVPFHMVAMGPIQSYDEFVKDKDTPVQRIGFDETLQAVERIARGLFKKFVVAYLIDQLFLTGFQSQGWYLILEIQVFALWVYLDFSAYMDVVVGLGKLMGVATPENFNRPYTARNITVFWERWHITLSQFIRRHIFIPTQLFIARKTGGRKPLATASVAFLISFVLCGLWHGLTWNFFLWGFLHALALVICNAYRYVLRSRLTKPQLARYNESLAVQAAATFVTFEFIAFSFFVAFPPVVFS